MDEINPKYYPKYYRCTDNTYAKHSFIVGKIYQSRDPNNLDTYSNFRGEDGEFNGWSSNNYKHFTPVTEHEWNLQEGIVTKIPEDYSYLIPIFKQLNIQ